MTIRPAVKEDAVAVKDLVKEVFADDPLMVFFLRQDHRKADALEAFYDFMVHRYCMPRGLCWVTGDVSGAALWMPPGKWEIPLLMQLDMAGVILRSFGWKGVMAKFAERRKIDTPHPKEPHYYLSGLAVKESLRGRGWSARTAKAWAAIWRRAWNGT